MGKIFTLIGRIQQVWVRVMMFIAVFRVLVMSGFAWVRQMFKLIKATLVLHWSNGEPTRFRLLPQELPMWQRRARLFSLYLLLSVGVLSNLFFLTVPSLAVEGDSNRIQAVSITTANIKTVQQNSWAANTGVMVRAQGSSNQILSITVNVNSGDIVGISINQVGASNNNNFGVSWTAGSNWPSSAFLNIEGSTAYFKCFSSSCTIKGPAVLSNDANYFVSAFSIGSDDQNEQARLNELKGYLNNFQSWFQTIANQQVNINSSISNVIQQVNGVFEWLRTISVDNNYDAELIQKKIDQLINQGQAQQQKAEQDLRDREAAEAMDKSGKSEQAQLENSEFSQDSKSLVESLKILADSPATNCKISGDLGKTGSTLDIDFCADPRPKFLAPLIAIPSAIVGFLLSFRIIKSIWREIQAFRTGNAAPPVG